MWIKQIAVYAIGNLGYEVRRKPHYPNSRDGRSGHLETTDCSIVKAAFEGKIVFFLVVDHYDSIQKEHRRGRFYEEEELKMIETQFRGGIFVDIGGNVGNHTIYAAKFLAADKVIVFEPNAVAYGILKLNVCLNNLEGRCDVHNVGLSDRVEQASVRAPLVHNLGSTRVASDPHGSVKLIRGDDVLLGEKVSFIKIDVEGHELQVLKGLERTIAQYRPAIFVEVEDPNAEAFHAFLGQQRYRVAATYQRYQSYMNFLVTPL